MIAGILIIFLSSALFIYWFRYSCILILRSRVETAAASSPVMQARFNFGKVQEQLKSEQVLDPLQASLDRDYRILKYLIEHAASLELESLEDRLLMADYRLMQFTYRLTR